VAAATVMWATWLPVVAAGAAAAYACYSPPAGKLGAAVAWLMGEEPRLQIREDLCRFKELIETGEIRRE